MVILQIFEYRANVIAESSESEMLWVLLGNTWFYTSWVLGVLKWKLVHIPLEKGRYSKKFYLIFETYGRKIAHSVLHVILFSLNVLYLNRGKLLFHCFFFHLKWRRCKFRLSNGTYNEATKSVLSRQFNYNKMSLTYIWGSTFHNNQGEFLLKAKQIEIPLEKKN